MNREDVIRMAEEAGFQTDLQDIWITYDGIWSEEFERFAALVAAAEREACAEVCEKLPETFKIAADEFGYKAEAPTAENYAAAIRARDEA